MTQKHPSTAGFWARLGRIFKLARVSLLQILQRNIVSLKRSWYLSPTTQPDICRAIKNRSDLYQSRLFRPKIDNDNEGPLPLVIMVHGGGFIMNNPSADDPLSRFLADTCRCLVLSIDYRKAPRNPFPAAYNDIVDTTLAVLDGETGSDLPIDRSNVFFCGQSAGGNLVLAAAQDMQLQGRIKGVIAMYPVVNITATFEELMATRPDPAVPDFLGSAYEDVADIYVGTTDFSAEIFRDVRLSPMFYKRREDLPAKIFIVGCEHDLLCHDSRRMAEKLIEGEESGKVETADGWQAGNVRWKFVKGQLHGFDHFPRKVPNEEERRVQAKEELYQDLVDWLATAVQQG